MVLEYTSSLLVLSMIATLVTTQLGFFLYAKCVWALFASNLTRFLEDSLKAILELPPQTLQ